MDHSTHACQHSALKFCAHCNTVWCQACKVEWRQNPLCLLNHYPYTYQPYYTPTWSQFGSSGSLGGTATDLTITNATCAHGAA